MYNEQDTFDRLRRDPNPPMIYIFDNVSNSVVNFYNTIGWSDEELMLLSYITQTQQPNELTRRIKRQS